jgi:hypothetical protein
MLWLFKGSLFKLPDVKVEILKVKIVEPKSNSSIQARSIKYMFRLKIQAKAIGLKRDIT